MFSLATWMTNSFADSQFADNRFADCHFNHFRFVDFLFADTGFTDSQFADPISLIPASLTSIRRFPVPRLPFRRCPLRRFPRFADRLSVRRFPIRWFSVCRSHFADSASLIPICWFPVRRLKLRRCLFRRYMLIVADFRFAGRFSVHRLPFRRCPGSLIPA